jgi:hypothetical protein
MKLKLVFVILLLALVLSVKLSAISDTLWIKTLQENAIMGDCFFSEDDSLLIINTFDSTGHYIAFYNSYTGDVLRKIYDSYQLGKINSISLSYKDTFLITSSYRKFNSSSENYLDFNVKFINYKTGQIVDSLPRWAEPELNPDSASVGSVEFSYDGTKIYSIMEIIESYDSQGKPVYNAALYVWDLATHSVIQKITDYSSAKSLQITPNSKYYLKYWYGKGLCISFKDIEKDSTVFEVCDGDSLGQGIVIFPKDTTHFLITYPNVSKLYNLNNFALEKTIDNQSINGAYSFDFAYGSRYLISQSGKFGVNQWRIVVYDLQENQIVYVYPKLDYLPTYGQGLKVSNNSQLIFDYYGRSMYMLKAKYETTSIKEPDQDEPQMIYPNPTNGDINIPISYDNIEKITICDINGYEIETIALNDTSNSLIYNSSKLSHGTYIVNLRFSNKVKSFKFIVNK